MELISTYISKDVAKLGMVLLLSLLIGVERESVGAGKRTFFFGGIRTYPLFAISAYLLSVISTTSMLPFSVGFIILGVFLAQTYYYKVEKDKLGFTTEMAAVVTYILGGVVAKEHYWLAVAITVTVMMLLQLKKPLEALAQKIPEEELLTFLKFLLLSAVVLPIIPKVNLTYLKINPYKTWLIVTAVCGISYGSYLLQITMKTGRGIILSALVGAIYSSTVTTVVLSKKAKSENKPCLYSGAMLMASGVMYLRIAVLLFFFSRDLFIRLIAPFGVLFFAAMVGGFIYIKATAKKPDSQQEELPHEKRKNPLELTTAFSFAILFIAIMAVTYFVSLYYGNRGIYALSAIMGVTDVDPFILSLTQAEQHSIATVIAGHAIIIATTSNNIAKGFYAMMYANRPTGIRTLILLTLLSVASLISFWVI